MSSAGVMIGTSRVKETFTSQNNNFEYIYPQNGCTERGVIAFIVDMNIFKCYCTKSFSITLHITWYFSNSYIIVCPPVQGDNPWGLAVKWIIYSTGGHTMV